MKFYRVDQHIESYTKKCTKLALEKEIEEKNVLERLKGRSYNQSLAEEFQHRCDEIKSNHTNNHLTNLLCALVQEQNQTEQILLESLKQLKKSHLLLRSQGKLSDETKQDFDVSN